MAWTFLSKFWPAQQRPDSKSTTVPYKFPTITAKQLWRCIIRTANKFDSSLISLIDVFHADLPSIGVTIADQCLVALPLRSLTIFRDDAHVISDRIDLN